MIFQKYPAVFSAVVAIVAAALTQLVNGSPVNVAEVVLAVLTALAGIFTHTQVKPLIKIKNQK